MKKLIFAVALFLGTVSAANAQISININIGNQPAWGPVGYDYARYYYLPEYNVYYDINYSRFLYPRRGVWVYANVLPATYGPVDLYRTYKVVVNRNYLPYRDNRSDMLRYSNYRYNHNQVVIRDSRDSRYYESRYHPMHQQWLDAGISRNKLARVNPSHTVRNQHAMSRPSVAGPRALPNRSSVTRTTVVRKTQPAAAGNSRSRTSARR